MRNSWIHIDADRKELCPLEEMSGHWRYWLQDAEDVVRAGVFVLLRGSESVASFTPFHLFIDWSGTWWLLAWCWCCCLGFFACLLCCVGSWPFILIKLSNNDYFSTAS